MEYIVRKGEIACYKQFLLFSQCFPQLYIFLKMRHSVVMFYPLPKNDPKEEAF